MLTKMLNQNRQYMPDWERVPASLAGNRVEPGISCSSITDPLAQFAPIGLGETKGAALLDRCEVKYVMDVTTLVRVLPQLQEAYRILEVAGYRLNRYRTLYFDTADFALYHRHHMGARNRYKVRAREYVESHVSFFEVKHKTNKRRTIKHRLSTPELVTLPGEDSASFLSEVCPYRAQELMPRLWNTYRRITLVSKATLERVTLDVDLMFSWQTQQVELPGVVIAEVKRPSHGAPSTFVQLMREQHIYKGGFSKYCMGVSLLYPEIKHNKFKPVQRRIARLVEGNTHVTH
jgi:hypothetical protein